VPQVNDSEIQLAFLHPSGPSKSYTHDTLPNILWVPGLKGFTESATGGTNVITHNGPSYTTEILKTRLCGLLTAAVTENIADFNEKLILIF
jgi:hypothetical protein